MNETILTSMLSALDWLVIILSLSLTIFPVYYLKKVQSAKSSHVCLQEYLVMGRTLTLPMFVATMVATWYGGIMATADIAYKKGIYLFVTQGLVWYLAYFLFAIFVTKHLVASRYISLAEWVEDKIGSDFAKLITYISLIKTIPIPYVLSLALIIQMFVPLSFGAAAVLGSCIVFTYTRIGGFRSIVHSDSIQFIFMMISVILVPLWSFKMFGGIEYLVAHLPQAHLQLHSCDFSKVGLWAILALSSTFLNPAFYQRAIASKNKKVAFYGIITSICVWFVFDLALTMGALYAYCHQQGVEPLAHHGYMVYALQILPVGCKGLFIAGVLATVLSTLDSFVFMSSALCVYDLNIFKNLSLSVRHQCIVAISLMVSTIIVLLFSSNIEAIWAMTKTLSLLGFIGCACYLLLERLLKNQNFLPPGVLRGLLDGSRRRSL